MDMDLSPKDERGKIPKIVLGCECSWANFEGHLEVEAGNLKMMPFTCEGRTLLFIKMERYRTFHDLGPHWKAYAEKKLARKGTNRHGGVCRYRAEDVPRDDIPDVFCSRKRLRGLPPHPCRSGNELFVPQCVTDWLLSLDPTETYREDCFPEQAPMRGWDCEESDASVGVDKRSL